MEPRINQCTHTHTQQKAFRGGKMSLLNLSTLRRNYERKHITDGACPFSGSQAGTAWRSSGEASPVMEAASSSDGKPRPQAEARARPTFGLGVARKNLGEAPGEEQLWPPSLFHKGVPCCRHFPAGPHMHKRQWEAPPGWVSTQRSGAFLPGKGDELTGVPTVCKQECRTPSSSFGTQ